MGSIAWALVQHLQRDSWRAIGLACRKLCVRPPPFSSNMVQCCFLRCVLEICVAELIDSVVVLRNSKSSGNTFIRQSEDANLLAVLQLLRVQRQIKGCSMQKLHGIALTPPSSTNAFNRVRSVPFVAIRISVAQRCRLGLCLIPTFCSASSRAALHPNRAPSFIKEDLHASWEAASRLKALF